MRFAAAQIPAKIGHLSLNGEKLDELHCVALIFGQFAVLHARSARFLHASICKAAVGRTCIVRNLLAVVRTMAMSVGTHNVRPNGDGVLLSSCAGGTQSQ